MAGPTFILSIWELVDGALGPQHSRGAAAHTVGSISKMGTLGTSIRALGGKEKVKKNGIPRSISYLLTRTNSAIQDPPSTNPNIVWPPCASLEVGPYHSLDSPVSPLPETVVLLLYRAIACGSALHGLAFRVAGEAFSLMGKLTRLPAVRKGEGGKDCGQSL